MKLPNLNYLGTVAKIRYTQNMFESRRTRNPDDSAGLFLSIWSRTWCALRFVGLRPFIRKSPWYWYILARTVYYDELFLAAIFSGFSGIINIGCGADTRSIRFRRLIDRKKISVAELDQAESILQKQMVVPTELLPHTLRFGSININSGAFDAVSTLISNFGSGPILVMMEGVSPYVEGESFRSLLRFLSEELTDDSIVAYDYKISGVDDEFGIGTQSALGFRLPDSAEEVCRYHKELGFKLVDFLRGGELSAVESPSSVPPFYEDNLVKLAIGSRLGRKDANNLSR
jgi:hypothetical protein